MSQELRLCVDAPIHGMPELAQLCVYTAVLPPLSSVGLNTTSPVKKGGNCSQFNIVNIYISNRRIERVVKITW